MDLKNKVAIITGARRGMGRTHALAFAGAGAKVVVSDISQEECEEVVKEIEDNGGEAIAVKCDVTSKEEVDKMVQAAVDKWGKLDILVNNAGIVNFRPFMEMTEKDWDKMMEINLKGYFLCAQASVKEMIKQGGGSIVNIASVEMGQVGGGMPGLVHYCASKGGVVAFTEALAVELAGQNIRVNAVSPGAIETPMSEAAQDNPDLLKQTLAKIPMNRMGKPEEVSNLVLFLASDAASYMTGSTVVIDGGWLAN